MCWVPGEVPADAYYGVHTLRAIENFYISNNKISDIPEFVRGMVMVKKAAAMANKELQTIPKSVANAIIAACDEVLNNGKCMDQFPVDVYQGGAGTSVNMNTNEVLANIGLELMGHQKGEYQYLNRTTMLTNVSPLTTPTRPVSVSQFTLP
ncbi:lyase family protein [Escherichia coli]